MKKSELKDKAETLIRQIRNFEIEYEKMLKTGDLNQEKINAIRIDHLKKLRTSLETGYLKSIDKLPENEPALPDESLDMADSNHILAIRTQFTNIYNKLSSIEREISNKQRIAHPDPKTLKASYDQLISELDNEKFSITFPEFYLEDNQLQTLVDQVKSHNVHTIDSSVGRMYRDIKSQPQSKALPLLYLIQEQYQNYKNKAQERFEKLIGSELNYQTNLQNKEQILSKAHELLTSERVRRAKEALKYTEPSDSSLSLLVQQIHVRVSDMTNKDYMAAVGFTGNRFNQLIHAKNLCKDDADLLQMGINSLETKLERIENAANDLQSTLENQIKLKTNELLRRHAIITTALNTASLDTKPLDAIKQKLDEALSVDSETVHPIKIARDTLAHIVKLLAKLNKEIPKYEAKLSKKEREDISQISSLIKKESKKIVAEANSGKFNFNETEQRLVNTIKDHLKSEEESRSKNSMTPLTVYDYREIQHSLDSSIIKLQEILSTHATVKKIIKENDSLVFVNAINTSPNSLQLLETAKQYIGTGYLQKLETLLPEFNPDGLSALNNYMRSQRGEVANEIKNKLTFIKLLSAKAIDCRPFLSNPKVLALTKVLNDLSLTEAITENNLMNTSFIAAIDVLNKLNLLTKENVDELAKSPDKCDVICQQALFNEEAKPKLSFEAFTALIEDFLKTKHTVAKAVNEVQKNLPILCQPWVLILVKESPALVEILNHESQADLNLQFLQPMLLDAKTLNSHIEDYLCFENTPEKVALKRLATERFKACLVKHTTTLDALVSANKLSEEASFSLENFAKVFNKIFDFSANYPTNDKKTKKELMQFTNDVIPLLLTTDSPENKKKDIVSLANTRFQREDFPLRILADVLQCITGAFLILMPIRYYALNKNPFFSQEKTDENEIISSITNELITDKNPEEDSDKPDASIK